MSIHKCIYVFDMCNKYVLFLFLTLRNVTLNINSGDISVFIYVDSWQNGVNAICKNNAKTAVTDYMPFVLCWPHNTHYREQYSFFYIKKCSWCCHYNAVKIEKPLGSFCIPSIFCTQSKHKLQNFEMFQNCRVDKL